MPRDDLSALSERAVRAPFSDGQTLSILAWQADDRLHPLTCPDHSDTALDVRASRLACPKCPYTQDWVPAVVIRGASLP